MSAAALVTQATRYAGPDATQALVTAGFEVLCHDETFTEAQARSAFADHHPDAVLLESVAPEEAATEAIGHAGQIDVLFNNHFCPPESKALEETTPEEYRDMLETLLLQPYRFIRALIPHMKSNGTGRIIMMTSAAPLRPGANVSLYTSARGAANLLVRSLAKELGPAGISTVGISPNFYASKDTYSQDAYEKNERFQAGVNRAVPLKRLGTPDEMQSLIAYLASKEAAFVSGEIIAFSGGWA